jgi:hypothetical protein
MLSMWGPWSNAGQVGGGIIASTPQFPALTAAQSDMVSAAKTKMLQLAERQECDSALSQWGIPSLTNVLAGLTFDKIYDGTSSQYQPSDGNRLSIQHRFEQSGAPGAIVIRPYDHSGNVMFLGPKFFDPSLASVPSQGYSVVQAIVLMHEAVHLVGNVGDARFGTPDRNGVVRLGRGSLNLTKAIADKCFPVAVSQGWFGGFYGGRR